MSKNSISLGGRGGDGGPEAGSEGVQQAGGQDQGAGGGAGPGAAQAHRHHQVPQEVREEDQGVGVPGNLFR